LLGLLDAGAVTVAVAVLAAGGGPLVAEQEATAKQAVDAASTSPCLGTRSQLAAPISRSPLHKYVINEPKVVRLIPRLERTCCGDTSQV
jgi:hypothetical protein